MEFDKSVPFKNWTLKTFECIYGGDMYKFEAGGTYNVPEKMALFFAKKLAVQELHALGTVKGEMLSEPDVQEYVAKCFPVKPTSQAAVNSFERIDIAVDETAKPVEGTEDANTTIEEEQKESEDEEDNTVEDVKNNAGAPVFKKPLGRPRKDAQYVK